MRILLSLFVAAVIGTGVGGAQSPDAEVLAAVQRMFGAMRTQDTSQLRAAFAPNARLVRGTVVDGAPRLAVTTIDEFISAIAHADAQVLDERIWDWDIRVDGDLATLWTKYEFVADGTFSHCGVDAFQLLRLGATWQIVHVADTARRSDCWHSPGPP